MKYLFWPIKFLAVCIYTLTEAFIYVLYNIFSIIWYLNKTHIVSWDEWTIEEDWLGYHRGYDKNIFETIKRRSTDCDKYQNYKR